MWQYQDSNTTPVHRQWMLFPLNSKQAPNAIEELTASHKTASPTTDDAVYDLSGRRVNDSRHLPKGIYIIRGRKVVVTSTQPEF